MSFIETNLKVLHSEIINPKTMTYTDERLDKQRKSSCLGQIGFLIRKLLNILSLSQPISIEVLQCVLTGGSGPRVGPPATAG